jgi:hypothetical protein
MPQSSSRTGNVGKKRPRKTGAQVGRIGFGSRQAARSDVSRNACQSPKYGRSPLRIAMRALAISRRSMVAIRRPNRVGEGARPKAAVLDISIPFAGQRINCCTQSRYTRCQQQCICLHSSITSTAMQHNSFQDEAVAPKPHSKQKGRRKTGGLGIGLERLLIRRRLFAAGRARRNRGSRPPDGR